MHPPDKQPHKFYRDAAIQQLYRQHPVYNSNAFLVILAVFALAGPLNSHVRITGMGEVAESKQYLVDTLDMLSYVLMGLAALAFIWVKYQYDRYHKAFLRDGKNPQCCMAGTTIKSIRVRQDGKVLELVPTDKLDIFHRRILVPISQRHRFKEGDSLLILFGPDSEMVHNCLNTEESVHFLGLEGLLHLKLQEPRL